MRARALLLLLIPVIAVAAYVRLEHGREPSPAAGGAGAAAAPAEARFTDPVACDVLQAAHPLPREIRESSGLARSARDPSLLWTHNDSGHDPVLFGVGTDGQITRRMHIDGARIVDWEDLESGRCGGDACLWIADIGDNDGKRPFVTVYRVREPAADAARAPAEALHARYPDGPQDAEALFAHPSGDLFIVTKGRAADIALYRMQGGGTADHTTTLQRVATLFPQPRDERDRVTAAAASPDGNWVAVRTYRTLYLYRGDALLGGADARPLHFDLTSLDEPQGEGVELLDGGEVWLSSEAVARRDGQLARLRCALPQP